MYGYVAHFDQQSSSLFHRILSGTLWVNTRRHKRIKRHVLWGKPLHKLRRTLNFLDFINSFRFKVSFDSRHDLNISCVSFLVAIISFSPNSLFVIHKNERHYNTNGDIDMKFGTAVNDSCDNIDQKYQLNCIESLLSFFVHCSIY